MRNKFDFLHENEYQSFLQAETIIFGGYRQACPDYTNDKFEISLQYLRKEERDEVDFLHRDTYQTFLHGDTISFGGYGQSCSKYSQ